MKGPDLAHLDIEEVLDLHGWLYTGIIDRMTVYSQVISQLEKIKISCKLIFKPVLEIAPMQ